MGNGFSVMMRVHTIYYVTLLEEMKEWWSMPMIHWLFFRVIHFFFFFLNKQTKKTKILLSKIDTHPNPQNDDWMLCEIPIDSSEPGHRRHEMTAFIIANVWLNEKQFNCRRGGFGCCPIFVFCFATKRKCAVYVAWLWGIFINYCNSSYSQIGNRKCHL